MEEDIKILEELIEIGLEDFTDITITDRQAQAVENLIARYKELEKINNKYKLELDYIPKSKVQEKIEELKECCKNCNFRGSICKDFKAFNQCTFQVTIKNLQKLIED